MKQVPLGTDSSSAIAMGCMRIADKSPAEVQALIETALSCGIRLFDHADIYGAGACERIFGQVLSENPSLRAQMQIQSKCGIRAGFYDFSCDHILSAVDGILSRLGIEQLDTLLFHRPDALAEPEEFSRAIQTLRSNGKVRQFGVSNMNPEQIRLLESWCGEKMVANQVQLSLMHAGMVTSGINVNVDNAEGTMQDGSVLPYCQRSGITLQAWSPLQYGMFQGNFVGNEAFPELNSCLNRMAERYGVTPSAIAIAWILRIPGRMQVILGTANPTHLRECAAAADVALTRQDWYELYRACGYCLP